MPRFYFDSMDGELIRDDEGLICADRAEMRRTAIRALPDFARDAMTDHDHQVFIIRVRDDEGHHVFHASLSLVADRIG